MPLSRAELQARLNELEAAIPGLQQTYGHNFIEAFGSLADAIAEAAAPGDDRDWVENRAVDMLERRGQGAPS